MEGSTTPDIFPQFPYHKEKDKQTIKEKICIATNKHYYFCHIIVNNNHNNNITISL